MTQVSFFVKRKDRKEEGMIKTSQKICEEVQAKGILTAYNDQNSPIHHLCSGGLLELLRFQKTKPLIFSYFGHPNAKYLPFIRSQYELFRHFRDKKADHRSLAGRMKFFILASLSYALPLPIKQKILRKADYVIVPLETVKQKINLPQCRVIPMGIDTETFRNTKSKQETEKINVAYIGHNTPIKGIKEVIDAFTSFPKQEQIQFSFHFSDLSQKTKQYIEKKKSVNPIILQGKSDNIIQVYNNVDILVLPFRSEHAGVVAPLVLLEAMSCEKAIITTDLPNIKEIADDSVLYVKPFASKKDIHTAIQQLLNNSELRRLLGKKSRERIIQHYSKEKMITEYIKLYDEIEHNQN